VLRKIPDLEENAEIRQLYTSCDSKLCSWCTLMKIKITTFR